MPGSRAGGAMAAFFTDGKGKHVTFQLFATENHHGTGPLRGSAASSFPAREGVQPFTS